MILLYLLVAIGTTSMCMLSYTGSMELVPSQTPYIHPGYIVLSCEFYRALYREARLTFWSSGIDN